VDRVVIGMDPHKRSVTIEVMAADETVLGGGRFGTDIAGYRSMLAYARQWEQRVWGIEGCQGIGKHVAHRLLADGEQVVDVPPKLSARARVFATGQGRKTDATDAHSVALVGTRMAGLRPVVNDEQLEVLRLLVDRRRSLGEDHTRMVAQLHQLLLQLIPGGAKKDLSAAQAKALLAKVRPRVSARPLVAGLHSLGRRLEMLGRCAELDPGTPAAPPARSTCGHIARGRHATWSPRRLKQGISPGRWDPGVGPGPVRPAASTVDIAGGRMGCRLLRSVRTARRNSMPTGRPSP
jgi:hypothetical protein